MQKSVWPIVEKTPKKPVIYVAILRFIEWTRIKPLSLKVASV